MNLDRQRMVVKLPHIRLYFLVALQEYLHEAAGGDRRLHLFQCRDDFGGIAACISEEVLTKALMSTSGFSKVLSLSEMYLLYKRVPRCSTL